MTVQGLQNMLHLGADPASPTFIIFSEKVSPRLNYTCRFIFEHVLKVKHVVTSGRDEFEASHFYRINYSPEIMDGALRIIPSGLLFENGIPRTKPSFQKRGNCHYLFCNNDGDLQFDIFSAVFFMISRAEEWQGFQPDSHGRFELGQSMLFKAHLHLIPVVDEWIMELRKRLAKFFSGIILPGLKPRVISTIDVDNLYAYSHKGFVRTAGAALRDVLKADFSNFGMRLKVLRGKERDPFDIYETFTAYCKTIDVPIVYFFLFRSGTTYDRTVDPASGAFKQAFQKIKKEGGHIGLHPSYYSNEPAVLADEIKTFSQASGEPVVISRQHYLRFNITTTPSQLIKQGIRADFSMGFASGAGFRAGTSQPFYFYNFESEEEADLLFIPFCAMDGAYTVYKPVDAANAASALLDVKKNIEAVNGLFITVFHERTFASHLYPNYAQMYKDILRQKRITKL